MKDFLFILLQKIMEMTAKMELDKKKSFLFKTSITFLIIAMAFTIYNQYQTIEYYKRIIKDREFELSLTLDKLEKEITVLNIILQSKNFSEGLKK